jgi:hypothetical protein
MMGIITQNEICALQRDIVASYLEGGKPVDEEGVEDAFELLHEINERVRTGIWVGDCFIYNNSSWRLNYCVGGEVNIVCSKTFLLFKFSIWALHVMTSIAYIVISFILTGHYNVSFGSPYVLVGIYCEPKSSLSY